MRSWAHTSGVIPMHRRTPTWFLDSLVTILKFPTFEQEALHFPFTLDHVNYVAGPVKGYSYAGTRSKPWGRNQLEDHRYRDPIREHLLPMAKAVSLMRKLRAILGNSQRMNFYPVMGTVRRDLHSGRCFQRTHRYIQDKKS